MTEEKFIQAKQLKVAIERLEIRKEKLSRNIIGYDTITFKSSIKGCTETIELNPAVIADIRAELLKLVNNEINERRKEFEQL